MADDLFTQDVQEFVLKHIDSIAELEALLLLRRSLGEEWAAPTVAARLYIGEPEAKTFLDRLCARGLLQCSYGLYRYEARSDQQHATIDRLAEAYSRHLIPITNLIHSKPRGLREFADAFRLRKERP